MTHQLQYLNQVDKVVLMKDGCITAVGTYEELMDTNKQFKELINTHVVSDQVDDDFLEEIKPNDEKENINQLTFEDSTGRCAGAFTRNLIGQITQLKYQSGLPHIRLQELIASNR